MKIPPGVLKDIGIISPIDNHKVIAENVNAGKLSITLQLWELR